MTFDINQSYGIFLLAGAWLLEFKLRFKAPFQAGLVLDFGCEINSYFYNLFLFGPEVKCFGGIGQ